MPQKTSVRTYSAIILLPTFEERFDYLELGGKVGEVTFGCDRYLNQILYRDEAWKKVRREVILRDNACDLAMADREIFGKIMVHHMNPITRSQVLNRDPVIFNPEYLITVSMNTHNAIHYGDKSLLWLGPITRSPNDTTPWKQGKEALCQERNLHLLKM